MNEVIANDKVHEECGVFGIYSLKGESVSKDIYYGLETLQHRGQEAAGIAVSDSFGPKGNILLKKDIGLVSEVFHEDDLENLKGNLGVGHVRYSTTGESNAHNAQPIAMNYIKGTLAVVHNGNIINTEQLKEEQMIRGTAHYTTSDTEVISYEIIKERVNTKDIETAIANAVKKIKGGYALLVASPRKLMGARDPLGIKPLILGQKDDKYILASESAAIKAIGGTVIRDIEPGEVVSITKDGFKTISRLESSTKAHCIFEYIYFARNDSVMDGISVNDARVRAGEALARVKKVDADIVVGVPDSGLAAAWGYSKESKIPFAMAFYKNSYIGRSFIKPTQNERQVAVQMKLSVLENVVYGKSIVLIDDSIVRGTTMRKLVDMLKAAGAKEVHVRISSPPFLYPCFYGTDVPSAGQLIASEHSTEEVRKNIGADSLQYLRVEDFKAMVGELPLCTACFTNEYPIK